MRTATRVLLGGTATGAAALGYAAGWEVRSYRLRRVEVPVLAPGARPLKVLHLSDLHLTPGQRRVREWVSALDRLEPDLVVDTGDNLAHPGAVPGVLQALGPLLRRPGAFVLGSNDYYAPRPKNPALYLRKDVPLVLSPDELPWRDLRDRLLGHGWADLGNARARLTVAGRTIDAVGTDDAHIGRDRYADVSAPPAADADLTVGVTHAPYRRVLDAMATDRLPLVLAGHTHGGQLCLPGFGAIVTNCDLPRRQASGLSRWGDAWLHVSGGLGTSPYARVRFACPPSATLLTLVPR